MPSKRESPTSIHSPIISNSNSNLAGSIVNNNIPTNTQISNNSMINNEEAAALLKRVSDQQRRIEDLEHLILRKNKEQQTWEM